MGLPDGYFEWYRGSEERPIRYGNHFDSNSTIIDNGPARLLDAIHRVFSDKEAKIDIGDVLDVGCANGGMIKRFHENHGLEVFGIENADWAQRNVIPGYEECIIFDDCRNALHRFETDSFDFVLECAGKYMSEEDAKECIKECLRIAKKVVVSTIASTNQATAPGETDDYYQVLHRTSDWWLDFYSSVNDCKFVGIYGHYLVAGIGPT